MESEIEKKILKKFMYNEKLKYNQIWDKKICSSSHFDYYFKKIIGAGLVVKKNEFYELSSLGIKFLSEIDGESLSLKSKPIVCAFVLAFKDGMVLMNKRSKQPFMNYFNVPGGKVEFGGFLEEEALREFEEETGLSGKLSLKIISEKISFEKGNLQVAHHIIGFFYLCSDVEGELIENVREGENVWLSVDELKLKEKFPELDVFVDDILNFNGVKHYKVRRTLENNKIVDFKIDEM